MCYVIECKIPFDPINSDQLQLMWITVEKNSDIKEVDVRLTSQYEYLSITHSPRFDYNRPYMITVPFGNPRKQRILAIENEIQKELFNFLICAIYCMEVDLAMINIKG